MPENRDVRVCEAANTPVECSSEKTVLRQQDGEASPRQVLLEVKDLEVTYGSGRKAFKAVNRANFEIYKGETFGLVGESGSGKTTIGRAIMRILPTSGGEILYKGQKINGKISRQLDQQVIKEIQMIFQDPQSSLNERAKVSYIVGEGLQNVRPDLTAAQREEKVRQALLDVGLLPEFASRFPHEFSGGQRQRIGIARALIVPMSPSALWTCPSAPRCSTCCAICRRSAASPTCSSPTTSRSCGTFRTASPSSTRAISLSWPMRRSW